MCSSDLASLKGTIEDYEVKALLQETPLLGDYHMMKAIYDTKTQKELLRFANKLVATPKTIALLAVKEDAMFYLIFMCSPDVKKLNMNTLLQDTVTFIDGRGGGSKTSAQGGGKGINNLEPALLYAETKVKEALGL